MSNLTTILQESRLFVPPAEFARLAHISSMEAYEKLAVEAAANPEQFWEERAKALHWFKPWDKVREGNFPFVQWFVGGETNVSYNCLDRHVLTWRRNKAAIIWEGEPGELRTLTYHDLFRETCRFANALKSLGLAKGDRVLIYMPLIPEAAIAMLACARLGLIHSVVFGGFSAESLRDRANDAGAKLVITADGGWRKGAILPLKENVDRAVAETPSVQHVVVFARTSQKIGMVPGRDHWWHELVAAQSAHCEATPLDAEHPLFILYTSGTTGKPKGVVHSTGGYLTGVSWTSRIVFDLKEEDTFWCTADVGWITGHSYVVYGPLSNGATTLMYEGGPTTPDPGRLWEMVERHRVSIFYTAPTAIRALMRLGEEWPLRHDLSSLRLLGTVGEPINPEAWMWYHAIIGKKRCPIVDTWWQTETGSIMISPLPGATPTRPGSATRPLPGISMVVVDREGHPVPAGQGGYLAINQPWPSMLRTVYGDPDRMVRQYFSDIPGCYFTGDGARQDRDGYFWILGRVDDVINISGHRLGTMEVESALVSHPAVAEAAVVGRPDEIKGTALVVFVTLKATAEPSPSLREELRAHVVKEIGALARPDEVRFTPALPKTRSGKIMRRLLKEIVAGGELKGDVSTLEDRGVLERLALSRDED